MIRSTQLRTTQRPLTGRQTDPIVLCAADDHYVKPLAVTLHSAAQHLRPGVRICAIVLDGGIAEANWQGLQESLIDLPIDLIPMQPQAEELHALPVSHHITHTAYLRLLAGRLLPDWIDKAIYLDADLLVRDDVGWLWDRDLGQNFALAVPDIACPYIDARFADPHYRRANPYFAAMAPVANWGELHLDPAAGYFNSGVMVLNVQRMRQEQVEHRLLHILQSQAKHVWCWDQYALNVGFAGAWSALPLRWNQGAHIFEYPNEQYSPVDRTEFLEAKHNPAIVHYTTEWKPWDFYNRHPLRQLFFEQLDQTAWRGWRPQKPNFRLKQAWQSLAAKTVKRCVISYRKVCNAVARSS